MRSESWKFRACKSVESAITSAKRNPIIKEAGCAVIWMRSNKSGTIYTYFLEGQRPYLFNRKNFHFDGWKKVCRVKRGIDQVELTSKPKTEIGKWGIEYFEPAMSISTAC